MIRFLRLSTFEHKNIIGVYISKDPIFVFPFLGARYFDTKISIDFPVTIVVRLKIKYIEHAAVIRLVCRFI